MHRHVALVLLAACGDPTTPASDAPVAIDVAPDAEAPPNWGEKCDQDEAKDDDGDGLVDEDCSTLFVGMYPALGNADPEIAAFETAAGRALDVIQTYHSTSALGVERTGPDLAAIFGAGKIAHLNIEPDPAVTDLQPMATAIVNALVAAPAARMLVTFGAEMNGAWTTWGCKDPEVYQSSYRLAWGTVVAAIDNARIDRRRVRWVWGPDARGTGSCPAAWRYFPGYGYVDLIGLSAYRGTGDSVSDAVIAPIDQLFTALSLPATLTRDRYVVLQTGSRDVTDRDAWITELGTTLATDPRALGVIYFDAADWSVPTTNLAFPAAIAAAPLSDGNLDATFLPHFWDVPYDHASFGEIQALRDHEVVGGCAMQPSRFCPDEAITKRDLAVILARAFALADVTPEMFEDVDADDPARGAFGALLAAGAMVPCVSGSPTTLPRFCPDDTLGEDVVAFAVMKLGGATQVAGPVQATRGRAAAIIARGARLTPKAL